MKHLLFVFFLYLSLIPVSAQKDWQQSSSKDGITIWTKDLPGSTVKQFKLKTIVKNDMKTVYNILRDIEKMSQWYDRVASVKLLKKISDDEGVYLLEYSLPFPFENRITTINGKMSYNTEREVISVKTKYYPFDIPKNKSTLVQITEIGSTWDVKKLPNGEIEIIHSGHMDPGGNIPLWLVNDGVTSGPMKTIKAFKKVLAAAK